MWRGGNALDDLFSVLREHANTAQREVKPRDRSEYILVVLDLSICWLPCRAGSGNVRPRFSELHRFSQHTPDGQDHGKKRI
jgi:hypothetical protein